MAIVAYNIAGVNGFVLSLVQSIGTVSVIQRKIIGARRLKNHIAHISSKTGALGIIGCIVEISAVPPQVYDFVMEKVEKWTLVPQKNIMIAATHSHTAGPIRDDGEFRRLD